jgi:hypothetical protein
MRANHSPCLTSQMYFQRQGFTVQFVRVGTGVLVGAGVSVGAGADVTVSDTVGEAVGVKVLDGSGV